MSFSMAGFSRMARYALLRCALQCLVSIALGATAFTAWGTGSDSASSPAPRGQVVIGKWIEKHLIVRHDSNWASEYCFRLTDDRTIQYRFTSDIPLNFELHVHPLREDGAHRTEFLDRQADLSAYQGTAGAKSPGTYCFSFWPNERPEKDAEVYLYYRIG